MLPVLLLALVASAQGFGFGALGGAAGGAGGGCGCAPPPPPPCPPPAAPPVCPAPVAPACPLPPPPPPPAPCAPSFAQPAPVFAQQQGPVNFGGSSGCGGCGGGGGGGGGGGCGGGGGDCGHHHQQHGGCGGGGGGGGGCGGGGSNDCCSGGGSGGCNSPCRFRRRKIAAFGAPTSDRTVDPVCNSEKLRKIMQQNMTKNTAVSKRAIQKAAQDKLTGKFDVICASGDFSYIVNSDFFCQESIDDITCYAFRQL